MAAQSTLVGRIILLLLGGATAAFVGYRVMQPGTPAEAPAAPEAAVETAAIPAPEPTPAETAAATPPVEPEAAPEPVPAPEPPAPPTPPGFDVVRIEPNGEALIAGKAPPDAQVALLLDGVQETKVQADSAGNFVALFTLAPNPAPRVLGLEATLEDGSILPGTATVAIAPIAAVVPVAPATEPEAAPPAALIVTEEGAEVVQAQPDLPEGTIAPVTLTTISYAPDGAVQLAGLGQAGALLRIYLDNSAIADVTVTEDGGWATTLPETAPGIYTLRIDQLDAEGKVTARTETPFKRETLEALAAATGVAAAPEPVAVPEPVAAPVAEPAQPAPEPAAPAPEPAPAVPAEAPAPEPVEAAPETAVEPPPAAVAAPVSEPEPEPAVEPVAAAAPVTITVQPGFTLWGIATDMMGEGTMYVQVFEANKEKIRDPDLIYPGQVFTLPQP